jgi:hypothetical protein
LGSQFESLVENVLSWSSNLGPNTKPKMLKVGPNLCLYICTSNSHRPHP